MDTIHTFTPETEKSFHDLTNADAVTVHEESHPDNLGEKILTAQTLMLGEEPAPEILEVLGGDMATGAGSTCEGSRGL
nr:hypothetical protein [uncultured Methanospirillum sp.]